MYKLLQMEQKLSGNQKWYHTPFCTLQFHRCFRNHLRFSTREKWKQVSASSGQTSSNVPGLPRNEDFSRVAALGEIVFVQAAQANYRLPWRAENCKNYSILKYRSHSGAKKFQIVKSSICQLRLLDIQSTLPYQHHSTSISLICFAGHPSSKWL